MALVKVSMNTMKSPLGELVPLDVQLNSLCLDLFLIACLDEVNEKPYFGYRVTIKEIRYTNPFDIIALLKAIPVGAAEFVLQRTLFYKQEAERRDIANELARQEIISKKLDNLSKASALQRQLVDGRHGDDAQSVRLLGDILRDQRADMTVSGPDSKP